MRNSKSQLSDKAHHTPDHEKLDPLYVIFEQHLYNFQDSNIDRQTFVLEIVKEYFKYLSCKKIAVPEVLEPQIQQELSRQVNIMLNKKIYGSLNIEEFQKNILPVSRRNASARYAKLGSS